MISRHIENVLHVRHIGIDLDISENIGIATGISFLSVMHQLLYGASGLMAAILNFLLPVSSYSIHNSFIVLPDAENMGIAVEISLLSCPQAEL